MRRTILVLALLALALSQQVTIESKFDKLYKYFNGATGPEGPGYGPPPPGPHEESRFIVGGRFGDLTEFFMNGSSRIVGKTIEFENTSWIAPAREGMLISNVAASIVSFVDFRGAHKLH